MTYDLFDVTTMNAVDWYDSLEEALASIRETIAACGAEAVLDWALVPEDAEQPPIKGEQLLALAQAGISV
jgi:hypothetical protein